MSLISDSETKSIFRVEKLSDNKFRLSLQTSPTDILHADFSDKKHLISIACEIIKTVDEPLY